MSTAPAFEARHSGVPIRELGLTLVGTPLEEILDDFRRELDGLGLKVRPRFYLSTEWGVPFETVAIAIPFYLAEPELAELHADRTGMVEGTDRDDVLRYLRHEMGHVINYAYKLYERPAWIERFGAMTQPYLEEYRPEPWSPRFVRHLPGWYAQKHPDEDWAETFAVWMTPDLDWRGEYASWPSALAKLELCDVLMADIRGKEPEVTDDEVDEDVAEIDYTIDEFYRDVLPEERPMPAGLDGALRAIFPTGPSTRPASALIRGHARVIARAVYTWTGHFPEHTRALVAHLATRADELGLGAPREPEPALIAVTAFVTSLAMNHVHRGTYEP